MVSSYYFQRLHISIFPSLLILFFLESSERKFPTQQNLFILFYHLLIFISVYSGNQTIK